MGHQFRSALGGALAMPRAPSPPARVWRDWLLVAGAATAVVLEVALRGDLPLRWLSLLLGLALLPATLWRRTRPLAAVAVVFGSVLLVEVALAVTGRPPLGLVSMVYVLVMPYALARWGTGREVAAGLGIVLAAAGVAMLVDWTGLADAVGGMAVLTTAVVLGAQMRAVSTARRRRIERVRADERVQLARELHDTVAHHVSAMAIQAQAGRALADRDPGSAVEALRVIEEEASRTLDEMRSMVRVLRGPGRRGSPAPAEYAPQPGVADLHGLATSAGRGPGPAVAVALSGDLDRLPAALDTALYRMAQEAVTNALRHARGAGRVDVEVLGNATAVELRVRDDGEPAPPRDRRRPDGLPGVDGFGLTGMAERAALLGGTFAAGPGPDRGWLVAVRLPREVPA
ncbi:sensor histidine kinase [Nocardioides sp. GCM10027113]|uniref:sensor histidine kinase n=1 Tax=unclassified Nocardioides TaxID=2615069 RepID=UPI00361A5AA8